MTSRASIRDRMRGSKTVGKGPGKEEMSKWGQCIAGVCLHNPFFDFLLEILAARDSDKFSTFFSFILPPLPPLSTTLSSSSHLDSQGTGLQACCAGHSPSQAPRLPRCRHHQYELPLSPTQHVHSAFPLHPTLSQNHPRRQPGSFRPPHSPLEADTTAATFPVPAKERVITDTWRASAPGTIAVATAAKVATRTGLSRASSVRGRVPRHR